MTRLTKFAATLTLATLVLFSGPAMADPGAFLEVTIQINDADRPAAAGVYKKYKQPFLNTIDGAQSKMLLVRNDDIQVLHGFKSVKAATAYLTSKLFTADVVTALKPYFQAPPEIRIYKAN